MSRSVCVGCAKTFDVPGADPAPYCLECEPAAQRAFAARRGGVGGWVLAIVLLAGLLLFVSYGMMASNVAGPTATASSSSTPVRSR